MARHTRKATKEQQKNTPINQLMQQPIENLPKPSALPVEVAKPVQEKMLVREEIKVPVQEKMLVKEEIKVPVQEKMLVRQEVVEPIQQMQAISHTLPKQELTSKSKTGIIVGVVIFLLLLLVFYLTVIRKRMAGSSGQLNSFYF
jgi:hypothetical protein